MVEAPLSFLACASLLCLGLAACADEQVSNQPLRQRGVQPQPVLAAPPARPRPQVDRVAAPESAPLAEPPPIAAEAVAAADEPEKPPRNLQQELESLMGSPVACLAPRSAETAPSSVNIALSASIMPSGTVARAEVSAPGLQPAELKCLRDRLESLRFTQPVEGAPLSVSGALTLQQAPQPKGT